MISSQPLGGWNFARFFKSNAVGNVGYPILYLLSKKKRKPEFSFIAQIELE
jgi:hypothetical protein